MFKTFFRSNLMIAAAVLLASLVIIMNSLYGYFGMVQMDQLKDELRLAACGVEESGQQYLEKLTSSDLRYTRKLQYRLTLVASDGNVIFDTLESAENMENHGERPEIRDAFATGEGSSERYSDTMMEQTLYYARMLNNGTVLRISAGRMTVPSILITMFHPILVVCFIAVLLSAFLASRMARKIDRPLNGN